MSFNNDYAGEQGVLNTTTQSSNRKSKTQSAKRGRSGAGTYSGVTKESRNDRNSPVLQKIISAQPIPQPDLWETINSIVIPKGVIPEDKEDPRRPRAKVRWEGLDMFGWVDGAWKPAGYHIAFREKLILADAQQAGAPVWRKGMSLDFTSHSPLIHGWSMNPNSIQDGKGRLVCLMEKPPRDWSHNPRMGYLKCEGLILLDQYNWPIKNFPGAPLTLKVMESPWIIEGLRRCLGMTYWDIRARMPPVRNSNQGRVHLQGYSHYSNHVRKWIVDVNEAARRQIMFPWQKRNKKPTNKTGHNGSSQQDEEDEEEEEELDPILTPSNESSQQAEEDEEEEEEELDPIFTPSNGFQQHEAWHANQMLTDDGPYRSSRPVGQPLEHNYLGQASTQHGEQTWEGNHLNIPTFPGANGFAQTTNTAPPEGIYSPGYPSTFAPQNIYSAAGYPHDFAPGDTHPSLNKPNLGTYLHGQTTDTVPSDSIYPAACPSNFAPSNIHTDPAHPFHLAYLDMYSSPNNYNNLKATAPGFDDILTLTSSVATTSQKTPVQPPFTYEQSLEEAWQGDFRLQQPTSPTLPEPNPPTTASQCAHTIATAPSAPILPSETAPIAISSPEEDPFMGADWSSETADDWL